MCEFCVKHGEGKKWYLQARNYSEDLLSDLRRRKFIQDFFLQQPEKAIKGAGRLSRFQRLPSFIRAMGAPFIVARRKKVHYGQVIPIEDVDQILSFVNSIVRLPCGCRQATVGTEQRYCYAVSMAPQNEEAQFVQLLRAVDASYLTGPDTAGFEALSKEQAVSSLRELEREGLCHTVWTFITPFIGSICNCDRSDCMGMRQTVTFGLPVFFRAEYVAEVNPDLCNGCRQCMRVCQFGAMSYSAAQKKVVIDLRQCYGCGICRASCTKDAITLNARSAVPLATGIW